MATAAGSGPHLELYHDSKHTSSFNLAGASSWTIGRSLECSVVINHPSVSRLHARIYEEDGGFYLTDMGSTHGTRLAEQALEPKQPVRLVDGVRVSIGSTERSLVPRGMLAQMLEAARAAAARQQAEEAARQAAAEADDDDDDEVAPRGKSAAHAEGAALLAGVPSEAAAAAKAAAEAEADEDARERMGIPLNFGKAKATKGDAHAAFERGGAAVAGPKGKKGKGIQMAAKLGTGLNVPAATPTLVALQERKAAEAAEEAASAAKQKKQAAAPKVIGAMAPARGPAGPSAEAEAEVGPPLPPGVGDAMVGPPMPPPGAGADDDAFVGPPMPPGVGPPLRPGPGGGPPLPPGVVADGGYDPGDLSQQVMPSGSGGGGGGEGGGDSDDDDDDEPAVRLPVSHQTALKAHSKCVTALALDPAGSRLVTGGADSDLYLWDFAGMTRELKPFRHVEEPLGGYQLRSIDFSPGGDRIIVCGASSQPAIFDRDGRKLATLMKGDMYIRQMDKTRGHVAACTQVRWHVRDKETVTTASEDGTVRLWDVQVAIDRGDDAMSLNVQGGQKLVAVIKDARGIKTGATAIAWHPDGDTLMVGGKDGSLQMWELRVPSYQPVMMKMNATLKHEYRADKQRPDGVCRAAHASGDDITCVRWRRGGHVLASRSTDGTLKLWDVRRFDAPIAEWGGLPCHHSMTSCDFSADGNLVVTGTGRKKGDGQPELSFFSTRAPYDRVHVAPVDGSSAVALCWHPRLNQIVVGNADAAAYVLYDPEVSEKGAMLCATRAAPKRSAVAFTGGAAHIITPHALPMFQADNRDHKKARREARADPLRSHKPEQVMNGPGTGGKLAIGHQQALLSTMSGGVSGLGGTKDKIAMFKAEDPREEILKYAKIAEEEPLFVTPVYNKNQPQVAAKTHLAKTVDPDEDEERSGHV